MPALCPICLDIFYIPLWYTSVRRGATSQVRDRDAQTIGNSHNGARAGLRFPQLPAANLFLVRVESAGQLRLCEATGGPRFSESVGYELVQFVSPSGRIVSRTFDGVKTFFTRKDWTSSMRGLNRYSQGV